MQAETEAAARPPAENEADSCCCGPKDHVIKNFRPVKTTGILPSMNGDIGIVSNRWEFRDYFGEALVRLGFFRMDYAVKPGLYATGSPGAGSPVFVSANYKLSFDVLRRDLAGVDGWILVLDTKGVNVWCAAGKGTFGTKEIAARVIAAKLGEIVTHRELIVPELGAPGVSAFKVMLFSGFRVIFGPVRSADIKKFLAGGLKADEKMRTVRFNLGDRLTVSLLELAAAAKAALPAIAALILIYGFSSGGFSLKTGFERSLLPVIALALSAVSGTVLSAALLPYLPGRAFSVKGGILGLAASFAALAALGMPPLSKSLAFMLFVSAASAYLTLNFTGASTFTSLSGAKKEVKLSLPVIAGTLIVSVVIFAVKG